MDNNRRILLCKEIHHNCSDLREIIVYPETLRSNPEMWIDGELNKNTGEEEIRILYGICSFHTYLEKRGYITQ